MSKVIAVRGGNSVDLLREAIEELGLAFVDVVKGASSIGIVSLLQPEATQVLVDAIRFHARTPIHVLSPNDAYDVCEGSIVREVVVAPAVPLRMPVRRPRVILDADVVMVAVPMFMQKNRNVLLAIEQYLFQTWYVPARKTSEGYGGTHAPWLEGELSDVVLADLYGQKPIALSFLDGSGTVGAMLAGFDAVAVDAVGWRMHDIDPENVGYLRMAAEQGLGVCTLSKIDVPLGIISR